MSEIKKKNTSFDGLSSFKNQNKIKKFNIQFFDKIKTENK
jgi:hypothetical protein